MVTWVPSPRSLALAPIIGSCLMGTSPGKSTAGPPRPGVLGGGVDSIAWELVLDGDERFGFDGEER